MTTPDVPLRMELTLEVPGTPEQVWDAIATANGISSWMMKTEVEERAGGTVRFYMGEDSSVGSVTGWDPPHRFTYEEPDWASLSGHDGAPVTPIVTEFLVDAKSGGTCVVRVVSSAFGTGADWEREFWDDMVKGWTPMFETLRLYLTHFPGQRVTSLSTDHTLRGASSTVWSAMCRDLGIGAVGQRFQARGHIGQVERLGDEQALVRLTDPVPGFLALLAWNAGDESTVVRIEGYLFSDDAPAYVAREEPAWRAWLESLELEPASTTTPS